jgi:N-glycosylase/DNA lyase
VQSLESVYAPEFDLRLTLGCGQVFHWQPLGSGYVGLIGDAPAYVEQIGDVLLAPVGMGARAVRYFALDHPLGEIYASFPKDPAMAAALEICRGLRIIRQPLWECLATFITSSLKQVAHIAQISHTLRRRYGRPAGEIGGIELFAYPAPERLAALGEGDLRACGLGFRAKSLLGAARAVAAIGEEAALESIRALKPDAAIEALTRFPGVGVKVANCALLFGYERLDAFPIDVWIERVLRTHYFPRKRKVKPAQMSGFAQTYFGAYGGYAQQYLFHLARTQPRKAG